MSFDLTARPDDVSPDVYMENDYEWPNGTYQQSPNFSAKYVRGSSVVPDDLVEDLYGTIQPHEAITYADQIVAATREHDDADANHLERLARFEQWLRYWGKRGVTISGAP